MFLSKIYDPSSRAIRKTKQNFPKIITACTSTSSERYVKINWLSIPYITIIAEESL